MGSFQVLHLFIKASLGSLNFCKLFLEFDILLNKASFLSFAFFVPSFE